MNRQGRPTEPVQAIAAAPHTFTGNRALRIEEALIFEIGRPEVTGVDLDEPAPFTPRLGTLERKASIGLPGLSEPETLRHYVRLSRMNYGIDTGVFPLGSCTMKHNPRLNEKMARLPGFGDIHPLQPQSTVSGALAVIAEAVHAVGAYFYADGANFNAIVGKVRPGDLGVDAMHINLHKTFSTPHGGGGPGAGPVTLSAALAPFTPLPYIVTDADGVRLVEHAQDGNHNPFGRMCVFHGQMG